MNRNATIGILFTAGLSLAVSPIHPLLFSSVAQAQAQVQSVQVQSVQNRPEMTLTQLESILESAGSVEGGDGQWQITLEGRDLIVLADVINNRMRIVAPIVSASEVSAEQVQNMLLANFHTALDARYALSNGTVVAVFIHPLASLDENYLRSALTQVATAANTFGTSYSSGEIGFGPNQQSAPRPVRGTLSI